MTGEDPGSRRTVRVAIADDEPIILSALAELIASSPGLALAGTAADAEEAIDVVRRTRPDVVLLDVRMPHGGGPRAAAEIDAMRDAPRTIAFSAYDDRSAIVSMLEAGACGYLVKGAPNDDIIATLLGAARADRASREAAAGDAEGTARLTVLVADGPGEVRESLTELLEGAPDIGLAGVAANAAEALRLSCIHRPSAVLVGRGLPGDAMSAIREIRQAVPDATVLAYTEEAEPSGVQEAVEAGAMSYLVTEHRNEAVLDALRDAAAGRSTLSPAAATVVVRQLGVSPAGLRERRMSARRRRQLERFIAGDGLTVVLQPVFDLGSGEAVAVEALARFNTGSLEGPSLWFARAAEEGLSAELELAALRAGLAVLDELPGELSLALNVSPQVAAAHAFTDLIAAAPAERIILELTEHAAVEDYAELAVAFSALRHRGVRVAVDDAGAGFASLRHVLMIEPDYLKLDISLCAGVARDRRRRALARALLGFAHETDIRTVAEGIESDEDLDTLAELGVEYAQGYHLAAPAPLAELTGLAQG